MRLLAPILSLFFLAACLPVRAQIPAPGPLSHFSRCSHSTCVWVPYNTHKTFHRGPYTYFVNAKDRGGTFFLQRGNKTLLQYALPNLSASVSVSWAPDNNAFSISWSNGGSGGRYQVKVFLLRHGKAVEVPAAARAFADFLSHAPCTAHPTENNVQAWHWVNAHDLLIVTSVLPNIFCGEQSNKSEGYIVRAQNGTILQHLNPKQLTAYTDQHPQ